MLHILSKFLPLPFYPLGFSLTLFLIGLLLLWRNKKRAGMICGMVAAGALCLFSLPATAHVLVRSLEGRFPQAAVFPHASAVVLLGGSEVAAVPPRMFPETNEWGDRIPHAARVFKAGCAPWLIVSGGKLSFVHDFPGYEADISAALLHELYGIDTAVIIRECEAKNTHDHGPNIRRILADKGLPPSIIVVTSAMHMYRSVKVFRKAGFTVYPACADYRTDARFQWKLLAFLPNAKSLEDVSTALHEYYGLLAYRLLGWI